MIAHLARSLGITYEQVQKLQAERHKKRGGFAKRIFITSLELADDDPWANYYAKDPMKYPEAQ